MSNSRSRDVADKDMDSLFEQTKQFEMELSKITDNDDNMKQDSNGFYNCNVCTTVHSSGAEYQEHLTSDQHQWSHRLSSDIMNVTPLTGN